MSGDSFVSGLEHSYRTKFDRDMHPMLMESAIAAGLKVSDNFQRVFLVGNSGATVESMRSTSHLLVSHLVKPSLILLQLGINDLSNGMDPSLLSCKLFDLMEELHNKQL